MTTLEIQLPEDIIANLKRLVSEKEKNEFIIQAIRTSLYNFRKKQSVEKSLKEGYLANSQEVLDMAKDFEASYGDGLDD